MPKGNNRIRSYRYGMRDPSRPGGLLHAVMIVAGEAAVPEEMQTFYAECRENARKAIEINRRAANNDPLAFVLINRAGEAAGFGSVCRGDGPDEVAALACRFADIGLRVGFIIPLDATPEEVGAPTYVVARRER